MLRGRQCWTVDRNHEVAVVQGSKSEPEVYEKAALGWTAQKTISPNSQNLAANV
jgi:hypothetical protein